jgi:hypothetical protein
MIREEEEEEARKKRSEDYDSDEDGWVIAEEDDEGELAKNGQATDASSSPMPSRGEPTFFSTRSSPSPSVSSLSDAPSPAASSGPGTPAAENGEVCLGSSVWTPELFVAQPSDGHKDGETVQGEVFIDNLFFLP